MRGERTISAAACWNALKGLMRERGCLQHGSQVQIRGEEWRLEEARRECVCGSGRTRVEERDKEEKAWRGGGGGGGGGERKDVGSALLEKDPEIYRNLFHTDKKIRD